MVVVKVLAVCKNVELLTVDVALLIIMAVVYNDCSCADVGSICDDNSLCAKYQIKV